MQKTILNSRHNQIFEKLLIDGVVRVDEMSAVLHVSPITIRRDLDFLHKQGLLDRIHGGALPLKNQRSELSYNQKERLQIHEKMAVGRKAAKIVNEQSIVFTNSGSTTLELIRNLLYQNIQIITNNIDSVNIPVIKDRIPVMELIIVGGYYHYRSHSLAGDMALASISGIYSSYTILGANGIHPVHGVTCSCYQHVSLHKKMIENCKGKVIIIADSSKINVISNFVFSEIESIDILVTDSGIESESIQRFADAGIEIFIS